MRVRALAWLILAAGMFWCRAGFVEDVFLNIDEAEYAVAADALDHGWLPGVDLLGSTKPPGIVLLYKLLFVLFGRSVAVLHAAHIVILIAAGVLLVELAVALWSPSAAVPAAVLFWMVVNSFSQPPETAAFNVEPPGILFVVAALVLVSKRTQSRGAVILSGGLLGLAAMTRQSLAVFALPAWAALASDGEKSPATLFRLVIGFILPWLPVVAVYAARGDLAWAWDSWVRYPLTYSGDAGLRGFLSGAYHQTTSFVVEAAVPSAMAIGGVVLLWRQRRNATARFLGWVVAASLVTLFSGSRFFGHYWIQVYPAVALLGVPAWLALAEHGRKQRLLLIAAIVVGSVVAALRFPLWSKWDPYAPPPGISFYSIGPDGDEHRIADWAQEHTTADETIAVWGYCPQIYYHARRLPGVRDYLCHYITGYSPGTFDPTAGRALRKSGHPQAEQMFIADLEERKPKYIFDLWQIEHYTFTFFNYPVSSYRDLAAYLRANYIPDGEIAGALIYRRRTPSDTWWPSADKSE